MFVSRLALPVLFCLALAAPAAAQDAPAPGAAPEAYLKEEFGDWDLICALATVNGTEEERCQIAQLLRDGEDTTVAEVRVLRLPEGERGTAIATVTTPLGTLLPPGLALAVDGGEPAVYPFSFCSQRGCVSRIGLTAEDVLALQRGARATLTMIPVATPDSPVTLDVSLAGFTAGYQNVTIVQREEINN